MEGCKEFMLFGTRIVIDTMRKTASLNNLSDYRHVADAANPTVNAADGYASDHVVKVGAGRERKRGTPWSEEEHKRFLMGLKKVGKGDWRAISKNFVRTRTPAQVASHAQKYFLRHTTFKSRRRSSLFDITTETLSCQVTGKKTEEKAESANGDGPSSQSQSQTMGSSNTCLPPAVATQMSPVLASSISSQVSGQQMTIRPPAPVALQLFPTLNSNSVRNYSPLSRSPGLSLPSHRQGSPNPAFRTMSNPMSKDSYISVA